MKGVLFMCKTNEHIHVLQMDGKISYTTSCSDCFQILLKNPDVLIETNQSNQ